MLIFGDFNFPEINWKTYDVSGGVETVQYQFSELPLDLFLKQYVDFPTRYREGKEPSTLDLIFTNEDYMVDNLRSCAPLGKSDHVGLVWTFQIYTGVYSRTGKAKSMTI